MTSLGKLRTTASPCYHAGTSRSLLKSTLFRHRSRIVPLKKLRRKITSHEPWTKVSFPCEIYAWYFFCPKVFLMINEQEKEESEKPSDIKTLKEKVRNRRSSTLTRSSKQGSKTETSTGKTSHNKNENHIEGKKKGFPIELVETRQVACLFRIKGHSRQKMF